MLFNSYDFILVFLPSIIFALIILQYYTQRKYIIHLLILSSFIFYSWWNWTYTPILVGSIIFNYILTRYLQGDHRKKAFIIGVSVNLGLLFFFKYYIFFVYDVINAPPLAFEIQNIVLPLGISFFTFQQISYLYEIYRYQTPAPTFHNYAMFVSFFPQLIAGPIVRPNEFLPQLMSKKMGLTRQNLSIGLTIFTIGLCKKVLLADRFAVMSDGAFAAAETGDDLTMIAAWGGAVAFSLQIYFDFSGYSDMAIGLARIVGIRLPENFRSPYKASNFITFWRHWHMTLSRFLRDFLYVPLGGNRKGFTRQLVNLFVVMVLGGLWHGAGWTFIVWGAIHGLGLSINHALVKVTQKRNIQHFSKIVFTKISGWIIVQFFVIVAWVFFRAQTFEGAAHMLDAMFAFEASGLEMPISEIPYFHGLIQVILTLIGMFVVLACPNTAQIMHRYRPSILIHPLPKWQSQNFTWRPTIIWALFTAALFIASFASMSKVSEFVYFQF